MFKLYITFCIYVQESPVGIQRDCAPSGGRAAKPNNITKFRVKRSAPKNMWLLSCICESDVTSKKGRSALELKRRLVFIFVFHRMLEIMAFL